MADYTSKYYGAEIDSAVGTALALKDLRGIIKITADGPVAAVANEDYIADSSSIVNVAGILKGVADAETGKIVVHKAEAGVDYQTPLKAGIDYATPTAVANKQNKINSVGLLKCTGEGVVTTAEAGIDYITPEQAKVFLVTFSQDEKGNYIANKTFEEISNAHQSGKVLLGLLYDAVYTLVYINSVAIAFEHLYRLTNVTLTQYAGTDGAWEYSERMLAIGLMDHGDLPADGLLEAYAFYDHTNLDKGLNTYTFYPPYDPLVQAHGYFLTGDNPNIAFNGKVLGALPNFKANALYEFDVFNYTWVVQEVKQL